MEVCVDSIQSVQIAIKGCAKRIELCCALSEGGLTPSAGFLKAARGIAPLDFPIFVMIRPRGGDFCYSSLEVDIMETDVGVLASHGANGFVFGCLDDKGAVDKVACLRLLKAAAGLPCTFHRAFDVMSEPEAGLQDIMGLGFKRLLTSGREDTAELGVDLIRKLVQQTKDSGFIVMPGAGLGPHNLREVLQQTGAVECHGSASGDTGTICVVMLCDMVAIARSVGIA